MAVAELQRRVQDSSSRVAWEWRQASKTAKATSWRRQLDVWRHGFYARQARMFDFNAHGFAPYLSEYTRRRSLVRLNGTHGRLLGDKLVAFLYLRAIGTPTPEVHGFSHGERLQLLDPTARRRGLEWLLEQRGKLVVKPRGGSGGQGFAVLAHDGDGFTANGERVSDVRAHARGQAVITDYVEQHDYARRIFPEATNTLRVVTARDVDTGDPFVLGAAHRFGTEQSKPVDNSTRGGMLAGIGLESGILGPLATFPGGYASRSDHVEWYEQHPDTGARVAGTQVPHWDEIVREVNRSMDTLLGLELVGWDVIVTPGGFSILEGNVRPDINPQMFGPYAGGKRGQRFIEGVRSRGGRLEALAFSRRAAGRR